MSRYRRYPLWLAVPGRFLAGRPLDGDLRSDSTFFRPGTRALTATGHASRWAMLAGWQRSAWRVGSSVVVVGEVSAYLSAPGPTLIANGGVGAGLSGLAVWRGTRAARRWRLNREVVRPLWSALAPGGFPTGARANEWLSVPVGYADDQEATVSLKLPVSWAGTAEQKRGVKDLVTRKIGGQWDAHWQDIGQPSLTLTHSPFPPGRVLFADVLDTIRALPSGQVLLGLGSRSEPVLINFDADTPHVAMNIGTGGGKSSTLCLIIVQLLAQGATVEGIDPKRVSLNPLRGLPGMRIHRDIAQQWDAIAMVRAEMDQRYIKLDADDNAVFSRLALVIEESNTFFIDSQDYWDTIKEKGDPKTPRIYKDINAILNKGRQVNVNMLSVFQRMDAQVSGGGAARDQYGMKILARFSPQAWKALVDTYPRPKASKHVGRAIVADGNDHRTVQTAYALDPDSKSAKLHPAALAHVLESRPEGAALGVPGGGVPASQVSQDGSELANVARTVPALRVVAEPTEPPVSLADAIDDGILTGTIEAVRKARQRDPEFPQTVAREGQTLLYSAAELRRWQANRIRVGATLSELLGEAGNGLVVESE